MCLDNLYYDHVLIKKREYNMNFVFMDPLSLSRRWD